MRTTLLAVFGCAVLPVAAAAEDAIGTEQFLKEAIRVHGGDKIDRFPAEIMKMEGKLLRDGKEVDFSGEFALQLPDRSRHVASYDVGGKKYETIAVINGDKGWRKRGGGPTEEMTPLEIIQAKDVLYALKLARMSAIPTDRAFELSYLPTAESPKPINGNRAWGIKVSHPNEMDAVLWIGEEKRHLIKLERGLQITENKIVKLEEFFDDYREVNGVLRPFRRATKIDGKKLSESRATEIKLYPRLDEKMFAKP